MKILILSLGFDERFAIRSILRTGLSSGDKVLIFTAEPIVDKAEKALQIVLEFLKKYFEGVEYEVISIPTKDFERSVSMIGERLMKLKSLGYDVILNLSGGMRSLIIELLVASTLVGLKGVVEVELENLEGYLSFTIDVLRIRAPLKEEYKSVLNAIIEAGEINLSQLSRKVAMAKSTIHKIVKKMIEEGLVEYEKVGKEYRLKARTIAKLFTKI
ncbi:MAG: CRISPR-associated CARF protein Csa3 [archaeon YNP-LCB-003-016]|uniref:CRISPR-associated CARF protein Csa3 n=1 Tax=Candidatus Culexarchaeum yellowstonense TaxID=2928963 RepID=UPI0026EE1370|nr:CRISPR-associated CARF protein Csa3 [Candidatus Culexarchaeum yellowstonense]MCR6692322.1 CRISPR-associated CARF protein Csa3 [Candidatus Culexarchaeum yellowstonense]